MKKRNPMAPSHIAYMEDADDDGQVLSGTEPKYARSMAPGSPRKQQPNTSKARRDSRRPADVCSSTDSSDSTAHPTTSKGKSKMRSKDERRSSAVVVSKQRPTIRSTKTAPPPSSRASDESYYTVPHHAASSRPRAQTRPESYYGQNHSRPPPPRMPISGPAFYQPPPPGMMPPSFPPPSWQAPFPGPMQPPLPPPPAPVDHHYPPRDLAMRFRRPSSSMGFRQASNPYEYEASPERSLARRSSMSRKASKESKEHEDRKRMPPPPPPRPKSTRPERVERPERIVLKPQPSSNNNRKSVVFDDDDLLDGDSSMYHNVHNVLRRGSGVEYGSSPFKNSRQSFDATESVFNYEDDEDEDDEEDEYYYEEEPPPPPPRPRSRSRRRSHIGIEDKIRDASRYQDHMGGGPTPALTAEALRKVKTGGSSRSTRSSASRDESEYKHSATTHTTRSSSGEDDITIKVSAGCVVEVGNVKIHSTEGGEVSVGRTGASRAGSDRGTSIYGDERLLRDDRRSRSDRSSTRMRANSQAAYARGLPAAGSYTPSPLYSRYDYDDDDSY
ncbi:hypothetical protein F4801DRAFT_200760 [Xylaria longipes]|nr:hypothetical protein F4801DRAFT_200760 [Xylaria longipes]RYC62667.1 hypothetical protein CHU98_g3519 [Xylaria longipes]